MIIAIEREWYFYSRISALFGTGHSFEPEAQWKRNRYKSDADSGRFICFTAGFLQQLYEKVWYAFDLEKEFWR